MILSSEITKSNVHDCTMVRSLLDPIDDIDSFTGDGAYDNKGSYRYLKKRGTAAIIPPRENAVIGKRHSGERNAVVEKSASTVTTRRRENDLSPRQLT